MDMVVLLFAFELGVLLQVSLLELIVRLYAVAV